MQSNIIVDDITCTWENRYSYPKGAWPLSWRKWVDWSRMLYRLSNKAWSKECASPSLEWPPCAKHCQECTDHWGRFAHAACAHVAKMVPTGRDRICSFSLSPALPFSRLVDEIADASLYDCLEVDVHGVLHGMPKYSQGAALDHEKVIHIAPFVEGSCVDLLSTQSISNACSSWRPGVYKWHGLDMERVTRFAVRKLWEVGVDRTTMRHLPHATVDPFKVVPLKLLKFCRSCVWHSLTLCQQSIGSSFK